MTAGGWTPERLRALPAGQVRSLYRNASGSGNAAGDELAAMILAHDLLVEDNGGLPFDHPIMLEIEAVCRDPDAVTEAIAASERGLPALAGMEHRLVAALGGSYGGNYTTNHAGRCIASSLADKGWRTTVQRPMPAGLIAKSATVFVRREHG